MNDAAVLTYNPGIFDVRSIEEAKAIILTHEAQPTDERWDKETGYLVSVLGAKFSPLTHTDVVLDYGCGIGRLAKALIERHGCVVIGVDISPSMRALAQVYVKSERFVSCSPDTFAAMVAGGLRVDAAYAVWVLQHCPHVWDDVRRIKASMRTGDRFVVVNDRNRIVPTLEQRWVSDGYDLGGLLDTEFHTESIEPITTDLVASNVAASSYIGTFVKREGA